MLDAESYRLCLSYVDKAHEATERGRGKHHIGDFLPPEELDNFVEKVIAVKEGRTPGQCAAMYCSVLWEEVVTTRSVCHDVL